MHPLCTTNKFSWTTCLSHVLSIVPTSRKYTRATTIVWANQPEIDMQRYQGRQKQFLTNSLKWVSVLQTQTFPLCNIRISHLYCIGSQSTKFSKSFLLMLHQQFMQYTVQVKNTKKPGFFIAFFLPSLSLSLHASHKAGRNNKSRASFWITP